MPKHTVIVKEGTNQLLKCNVDASPKPTITWEDKSGTMLRTCHQTLNCYYEIKSIQRDAGRYTCNASNSEGSQISSIEIEVQGMMLNVLFYVLHLLVYI